LRAAPHGLAGGVGGEGDRVEGERRDYAEVVAAAAEGRVQVRVERGCCEADGAVGKNNLWALLAL
jgi:hypothetical protein